MIDARKIADDSREATRAWRDDLHPATAICPDYGGLKIVLHRIQYATSLGLGRQIRDRSIVSPERIGSNLDDCEDDHDHDHRGDHDFDQSEAGTLRLKGVVFHRLMTIFCTKIGFSSRTLKTVESEKSCGKNSATIGR